MIGLVDYIPKPVRKSVSVLKDKFISLFKTNTPEQNVYGRGQKLSKPRKQNIKRPFISEENKEQIKERIIRDIWKLFETKGEKKERKKPEYNERLIKDKVISIIRTLFEQQKEYYYKPKRVSSFWNNNYIEYESKLWW